MKILNFGSCNIDMVYGVEHIVCPGETISSAKMELFPGGKGLNQSIALARAGAEVYHAGSIGSDGEMLRDILNQSGVNTDFLKTVKEKTGHAIIQVENSGENCILLFSGANHAITTKYIDEVLEKFCAEDVLVLQNEISNLPYLVKAAAKKGLRIVLNPSPFNEVIKDIDLNDIYCLILNEIEAKDISGTADAKEFSAWVKKNYPKLKVMLTLGKKGCRYIDGDSVTEHPIFPVKTVDTTAAGDTFTGYFVTDILSGKSVETVLRNASAASAIAVSKAGAAPSIPLRSEVDEMLSKL